MRFSGDLIDLFVVICWPEVGVLHMFFVKLYQKFGEDTIQKCEVQALAQKAAAEINKNQQRT